MLFYTDLALRVRIKLDPSPTSLSTRMLPPICSTIYLQILRPRPFPSGFYCLCSLSVLKVMNKLSNWSFDMPHPKSRTSSSNLTYWVLKVLSSGLDDSNGNENKDWFASRIDHSLLSSTLRDKFFRLIKTSYSTSYVSIIFKPITILLPALLNFNELLSKLTITCRSLFLSPCIDWKTSIYSEVSAGASKVTVFKLARWATTLNAS